MKFSMTQEKKETNHYNHSGPLVLHYPIPLRYKSGNKIESLSKDLPCNQLVIRSTWFKKFEDSFSNINLKEKIDAKSTNFKKTRAPILQKITNSLVSSYENCHHQFRLVEIRPKVRTLTKNSDPAGNFGYDNVENNLIVRIGDIISSPMSRNYHVEDCLGQGTFGQVFRCMDANTKQYVAVKVIKNHPSYYKQAVVEVQVAKMLFEQYDDQDRKHIIRLLDYFNFRGHLCIVFELLGMNLYELLSQTRFRGLSLNVVRGFLKQCLEAISKIGDADIIHCDLKPENILLVGQNAMVSYSDISSNGYDNLEILKSTNDESTIFYSSIHLGETRYETIKHRIPFIKIIDFGSACFENQTVYSYIQSRFYRAPEVLLGLPYDGAIDMWSLGCISAEMFLGLPLFPGVSDHNQIKLIVDMLGLPPDAMLKHGTKTLKYFKRPEGSELKYSLKTAQEYALEKNQPVVTSRKYFTFSNLEDIIDSCRPHGEDPRECNREEREAFSDFLHGLLAIDPSERWTPRQAATHPFLTGKIFEGSFKPLPSLKRQRMRPPMQSNNIEMGSSPVMMPWNPRDSDSRAISITNPTFSHQECSPPTHQPYPYPNWGGGNGYSYPPPYHLSPPTTFHGKFLQQVSAPSIPPHLNGKTNYGSAPQHIPYMHMSQRGYDGSMMHPHSYGRKGPYPSRGPHHSILGTSSGLGWHPPVSAPRSYGGMGGFEYSSHLDPMASYQSCPRRRPNGPTNDLNTYSGSEESTSWNHQLPPPPSEADWDPFFFEGFTDSINIDSPSKPFHHSSQGISSPSKPWYNNSMDSPTHNSPHKNIGNYNNNRGSAPISQQRYIPKSRYDTNESIHETFRRRNRNNFSDKGKGHGGRFRNTNSIPKGGPPKPINVENASRSLRQDNDEKSDDYVDVTYKENDHIDAPT